MKSFYQFILEANRYGIPEDEYRQWQRDRAAGKGPARKTFGGVEYEMRSHARAGQPKVWAASPSSSRKASSEKRNKAEQETQLSQDELRSAAGGDQEKAALALDTERSGIGKVKQRVKRISKATGVRQSLGHKQPLQPDEPSPEDPGHTRSNIGIEALSPNTAKKSRRPKPGEPGYGLTRSQARKDALRRGEELGSKIDRERELLKQGKPSRAAQLLARLRKPKPKFKNSAERAREQEARMTSAYDKKIDDALNA